MVLRVKITILGEPTVGKTSLVSKYCKNQFPIEYRATLGADFITKLVKHKGKNVELILWDIGGSTSFEIEQMSDFYLQGSNGFFLVFDLTLETTLKALSYWYSKANRICGDVPFILLGNKNDLKKHFKVDNTLINDVIQANIQPLFFRTSAKTGENVENAMIKLLDIILLNEEVR